jgi:hypothetical protein
MSEEIASSLTCVKCNDEEPGDDLLKSLRMMAAYWANDAPANESIHADGISEGTRSCGRALQRLLDEHHAAADAPPAGRFALVEQMGFRSTVATVREVTFCGAPMLEVTDLKTGSVHLASPQSLYEVTWLTEPEARQRAKPWTAAALPAADPWGTADSDPDDDATEHDGAEHDEGNDTEAEAERAAGWIEDRSCRYGDAEPGPGMAGEPRDLEPQALAHPWFGPAGASAAAPAGPIEAAARREVSRSEGQPQQQPAATGTGPQPQRMLP